ncbi:glycosyltransferase family 2 protein [Paenibacillus sp. GCM10027627]|uniref:glycosyltransferase family 2 protein n=1 Tax=unclassified Paenibacillus TaxID=185978 RepID=UPI00363FFC67
MRYKPLVSVIIPTYNRVEVLPSAIQSVIDQTYSNWELIIVSDGCEDHTEALVQSFSSQDSRIRYLTNSRSKGVGGARNSGMLSAKGSYVSFLDSDDEWFPFHLQDSLQMIQDSRADISFALWEEKHGSTLYRNFDNDTEQKLLSEMRAGFETNGSGIVFEQGLLERFLGETKHFYCINTMVFRKDLLHTFGLFNEQFRIGEDTSFIIQFFDRCRIALITKSHFVYNQSPDSVYQFIDRRNLNPDTLYRQKEIFARIEAVCLQNIQFRLHVQALVNKSSHLPNHKRMQLIARYTLARQYYTLSYINKWDKRKALKYCFQSMKHSVNAFNLLLVPYILFSGEKGSEFLKRPVNLY